MAVPPLPFRLHSRPALRADDVAAQFAPLVEHVNGGIVGSNFARRAGIRNAQKAAPRSIVAVQARAVSAASPSTVKLACPVPPRSAGERWENFALQYHFLYGGGWEVPIGYSFTVSGAVYYGGTGRLHNVPFVNATNQVLLLDLINEDNSDPDTGNVYVEVDLSAASAGWVHMVTAWFYARHQR